MTKQLFANNARSDLSAGISNSDTTVPVTDGSVFPNPGTDEFFLATVDDGTNIEIVKCTARSGNSLTVTRAQEGSTAVAFSTGALIELRATAETLETLRDDAITNGLLSKDVAGGTDVTLTASEDRNQVMEFTGALTANISVIVTAATRMLAVYNNTSGAFTLTVKVSGQTGVAVGQGNRAMLYCDGTDVVRLAADA